MHAKDDEFPILCETCLGENPLVRMTKEQGGRACKICERPFTVYRWKPGPKARYKKTELCRTCARIKNACQTCILDLQFGLPLAVRDQALAEHQRLSAPKSDVGRGYMIEQQERALATTGEAVSMQSVVDPASVVKGSMLDRLARREPFYKRNLAHYCSFYARGECNRGVLCPFRHEMPPGGDLAKQNFKDRYYGNNDPVARKMLGRLRGAGGVLLPPEDKSITTLWIGGLDPAVGEDDIRAKFFPFGDLTSVRLVGAKQCAFVTFASRVSAEEAAKKLHDKLELRGQPVKMSWAKPKGDASASSSSSSAAGAPSSTAAAAASSSGGGVAPPPGVRPPPGISFPAPPPGIGKLHLAAADPRQNATKMSGGD